MKKVLIFMLLVICLVNCKKTDHAATKRVSEISSVIEGIIGSRNTMLVETVQYRSPPTPSPDTTYNQILTFNRINDTTIAINTDALYFDGNLDTKFYRFSRSEPPVSLYLTVDSSLHSFIYQTVSYSAASTHTNTFYYP